MYGDVSAKCAGSTAALRPNSPSRCSRPREKEFGPKNRGALGKKPFDAPNSSTCARSRPSDVQFSSALARAQEPTDVDARAGRHLLPRGPGMAGPVLAASRCRPRTGRDAAMLSRSEATSPLLRRFGRFREATWICPGTRAAAVPGPKGRTSCPARASTSVLTRAKVLLSWTLAGLERVHGDEFGIERVLSRAAIPGPERHSLDPEQRDGDGRSAACSRQSSAIVISPSISAAMHDVPVAVPQPDRVRIESAQFVDWNEQMLLSGGVLDDIAVLVTRPDIGGEESPVIIEVEKAQIGLDQRTATPAIKLLRCRRHHHGQRVPGDQQGHRRVDRALAPPLAVERPRMLRPNSFPTPLRRRIGARRACFPALDPRPVRRPELHRRPFPAQRLGNDRCADRLRCQELEPLFGRPSYVVHYVATNVLCRQPAREIINRGALSRRDRTRAAQRWTVRSGSGMGRPFLPSQRI